MNYISKKLNKSHHGFILILIFVVFLITSTTNLNTIPPAWWDEGWTLNVARNWVELGHYGQLINNQPRGPGLSSAFPIVAPVAFSFHLFGIGVWQGRLPSVIYLIGSLLLIYYLACILYNRKIAIGCLIVLLFLSGPYYLHPLTSGRTVMGEMPMIFFLLAGNIVFYHSLRKRRWLIFLTALLWGVGISTKAQPLPFWLISLLIPLGFSIGKRWWNIAILVSVGIVLSWLTSFGLASVKNFIIQPAFRSESLPGLMQTVAIILKPFFRLMVLGYTLLFGSLTVLGISYATRNTLRKFLEMTDPNSEEIVRLVILGFLGSWLAWYALLSLGLERYLFPVVFIGCIFSTSLIYKLTNGFNLRFTIHNATMVFFRHRERRSIGALLVIVALTFNFVATMKYLYSMFTQPGIPILEITQYIESISNPDDLIESYESELFFLLDRPYHYPPDIISLQWMSSTYQVNDDSIDYDPIDLNPDYLVIGGFGKIPDIYDSLLSTGKFQVIKTFPGYKIYANMNN